MRPLSVEEKSSLKAASDRYHETIGPAVEYLTGRGISQESIDSFHLGFVEDPISGDEKVKGWLAIPSLGPDDDVRSIRFRCLEDHDHEGHGKYMSRPGAHARLFNPRALLTSSDFAAITEGEIDAISLVQSGIPAVGVPGASTWQGHWSRLFAGFDRVYIFGDSDPAGKAFAKKACEDMSNAVVATLEAGFKDVNELLVARGSKKVLEQIGARR